MDSYSIERGICFKKVVSSSGRYAMDKLLLKYIIIALIGLMISSVAVALPASTDGSLTLFPFTSTVSHEIQPILQYNGAFSGGRTLSVVEGGLAAGITDRLSLGATLLYSNGHGHSAQNTYRGDGEHFWAGYRFLTMGNRGPSFSLIADRVHDDITLHYVDPTTTADAWPHDTAMGGQLTGELERGSCCWLGRVGVYNVDVSSLYLATVKLLGGGVKVNLTRKTSADLLLTGFEDTTDASHHFSGEITGGVTYAPKSNSGISLSASLFPRGVSMAGSAFSPASAVGTSISGSATDTFRTQAIGYITLGGYIRF
jgi:hypothetical protein